MKKILIVLTVIIAISVVLTGTVTLLAEVHPFLPGHPLYTLQFAVESIRLELTFNPTNKADRALDLAERRLEELIESANGSDLELAASYLENDLNSAVRLILAAPLDERSRLIDRLNVLLVRVEREVNAIIEE